MAGFGNVCGLLLTYAAYRTGAVGMVSTIDVDRRCRRCGPRVLAGEILARVPASCSP